MEIRTVRKPGDTGTQALMQKYGERLVCIRYRCDPAHKKRYKTVELIIAEQEWQPPEPHPPGREGQRAQPQAVRHAPRRHPQRDSGDRAWQTDQGRRRHVGSRGALVVRAGGGSPKAWLGTESFQAVMGTTYSTQVLYVGTGYYGY